MTSNEATANPTGTADPPEAELSSLEILINSPIVPDTTSTVTVQIFPANNTSNPAKLNPEADKLTWLDPLTAVSVRPVGPIQVVLALAGEAIIMPAGKVSVNCKLVKLLAFKVLSIKKVKVLGAPKPTVDGAKDFENPGRLAATVKFAEALFPVPALDVTLPVTFKYTAGILLVTLTETAHGVVGDKDIPLMAIVAPPSGALILTLVQLLIGFEGVERVTPAGKLLITPRLETMLGSIGSKV